MPDYDTIQKKRNLIVGGFVIIAFCAFLYMLFLFKELPTFVSQYRSFEVLVKFADAPGLQKNTPVKYCGYQIGRVINVMAPERIDDRQTGEAYHQVKATLAIEKEYKTIPSHVNVLLMKRGLGSSYIVFEVDLAQEVTDFLKDGDMLVGYTGVSSEFIPKEVQEKIEKLVDSVSSLADHANSIIGDPENQANIKETLSNVTVMVQDARETLKSLKEFSDTGTEQMASVSEQLNDTLDKLRGVLSKINEGESTAAKLLNDGRLYENLIDSTEELQMALEQLKKLVAQAREKGIKINW